MTKLWIFSLFTLFLVILPLINAISCGNCNSGTCNYNTGDCKCYPGYFNTGDGQSCKTPAKAINHGTYKEYDIEDDGNWNFFYISLSGIDSYIEVDFKLEEGQLLGYSLLQSSDEYEIPTPSNPDAYPFYVYSIDGGDTALPKRFTQTQVSNTDGGWLVIALQVTDADDDTVELKIQYTTGADLEDDTSTSVNVKSIIIGVAVAAGVIFMVALCVLRRVRMRRMRFHQRQRAANRRRASEDIEADPRPNQIVQHQHQNQHQNHPPVDPNQNYAPVLNQNQAHLLANQNNRPAQPAQHNHHHHGQRPPGQVQPQPQVQPQARPLAPASNLLTKEEIQKYFPKKPYKELETPFPQTTCSICIDEFRPEVICHQLYCHHIFHGPCIEAWLAKHDSCPDCRKPITRKAIREFLKAEKKRKEEEQRAANKVKIMKDSVRASKSVHKSTTLQRKDSDHQAHQPQV